MRFLITVGFGAVFRTVWKMATRPEWCIVLCDNNFGAWRSSVARLLWEQEVPGSNPGAPTTLMTMTYGIAHLLSVLSIPQIGTP